MLTRTSRIIRMKSVRKFWTCTVSSRYLKRFEQYIQAASAEPAMEESAIFDAVVDIVIGGEYDYYIYDLVPLGHALYYLSMAKV